jgi:hypothetical protein
MMFDPAFAQIVASRVDGVVDAVAVDSLPLTPAGQPVAVGLAAARLW